MKVLITIFFMLNVANAATLPEVTQGETITASKMNSVIDTVNKFDNKAFQLGDIKISALENAQFQSLHGDCWVLMDGRSVAGKDYSILTGNSTIPDGRGVFIRGKNNGKTGEQSNSAGDLAIGMFESDDNKDHHHGSRTLTGGVNNAGGSGLNDAFYTPNGVWWDHGSYQPSSTHARSGSTESRPKNITMNYFIKIHNTCN